VFGNLRKRPASSIALALSLAWTAAVIYEVEFRSKGTFFPRHGLFLKVYSIIQASAIGVLGFLALAVLVERVWPDLDRSQSLR
jgi:hypothetical protein